LIIEYISTIEKIENSLYSIDINQISSINGKKINNSQNLKSRNLITKSSQSTKRLGYFHSLEFFDNHISVLMVSILAGGLTGILVVSCISIRDEQNFEKRLYSKF